SDSISDLPQDQFQQIKTYDGSVTLNMDASQEEREAVIQTLNNQEQVNQTLSLHQEVMTTNDPAITQQIVTVMAFNPESDFEDFFLLEDLSSEQRLDLPDDGILITAKLASLLDVTTGDKIVLTDTENVEQSFVVKGIVTNYLGHDIYMSEQYYADTLGTDAEVNSAFVQFEAGTSNDDQTGIMEKVKDMPGTIGSQLNAGLISDFEETLAAFFRSLEVSMYVYRETLFLTLIGIIVGNFMGYGLLSYILETISIDQIYFPIVINWDSYLFASFITMVFSLIVMVFMHIKLKNIEMVSALKEED
ncbi:MAG: ABC transporter permease, partial [Aerococcus viridans]